MQFCYNKILGIKYIGTALFIALLILLTYRFIIIFSWMIVFYGIGIWMIIGAIKSAIELFKTTIVLERSGIHFYNWKNKEFYIPWEAIEDFSFTETRCIMKVGSRFFSITRELSNFDEFEGIIADQMTLPKEQRGANLPIVEHLEKEKEDYEFLSENKKSPQQELESFKKQKKIDARNPKDSEDMDIFQKNREEIRESKASSSDDDNDDLLTFMKNVNKNNK
jgi:hypothetical protein